MLSRRLAFLLNYAGIAGVVLGLSKVHATWLAEPGYDFTRSFRLPWAVVFVAYLSVAASTCWRRFRSWPTTGRRERRPPSS